MTLDRFEKWGSPEKNAIHTEAQKGEPLSILAARLSEKMVSGLLEDKDFTTEIEKAGYPVSEADMEKEGSKRLERIAEGAGLSLEHIVAVSKRLLATKTIN